MPHHDSSCSCGRCRQERRNRGTQSLGIKIALKGGIFKKGVYVSTWAPYCDKPVTLDRYITSRQAVDNLKAMEVSMQVPCRKCEKCLRFRQMKWRERAISELSRAKRTWFVTLTFSPIHLAGILLEAKGPEMKFIESAAYKHVQRYIKRLRKGNFPLEPGRIIARKAPVPRELRYLAIYERGEENGRSHYHLFLHETGPKPITKDLLEVQWRSFVHARLVSGDEASGAASYLTKYATKQFDIRPRASSKYGKPVNP